MLRHLTPYRRSRSQSPSCSCSRSQSPSPFCSASPSPSSRGRSRGRSWCVQRSRRRGSRRGRGRGRAHGRGRNSHTQPPTEHTNEEWSRNATSVMVNDFTKNVGPTFPLSSDPLDVFLHLFPPHLIDMIVTETNRIYAAECLQSSQWRWASPHKGNKCWGNKLFLAFPF